jgi:hypothetical protein
MSTHYVIQLDGNPALAESFIYSMKQKDDLMVASHDEGERGGSLFQVSVVTGTEGPVVSANAREIAPSLGLRVHSFHAFVGTT